ncbi:hypothetical protein [Caballeronia sp. DA-9]|uniref:hypothetical protein n=1 Tax=Caballeronia sp. DA-9 TaxID=3436237 RepID=UPI003F674820
MHQPRVAPLAEVVAPSLEASLSLWECVMRAAVAALRAAQPLAAFQGYEHALAIAHRLIEQPPEGRAGDCVAALVVSHHNLADLELERGRIDHAVAQLCAAHEALLKIFLDTTRGPALQQAALRHSRETHVALLNHVATHGPHTSIARTLELGERALNASTPLPH